MVVVQSFNEHCLSALDIAARIKTRSAPLIKSSPRINENTCSLHVHYLYLKEFLMSFNNVVKDARATYFSNLISNNPKVLFYTLSNIVTPASPAVPIFSTEESNKCPSFFVG